jgi:hypothetical protein
MALLPEKPKTHTENMTVNLATNLYVSLKKKHKLQKNKGGFTPKDWSKTLLTFIEASKASDMVHVMNWYCCHIGEQYVPEAFSAKGFVEKYDAIKRAMEREGSDEPDQVSQLSLDIAEDIKRNIGRFPVEIESQLGMLVEKSRLNWRKFVKKMESYNGTIRNKTLINVVLTRMDTGSFAQQWFYLIHQKHGFKKNYTGRVLDLVFKPDSKLFLESLWRECAVSWSGAPCIFDSLLEELNNEPHS